MSATLFDLRLRALRRDRAFRRGPELFLHERAFADCLERIRLVRRRFSSALIIGCPDPCWPARLAEQVGLVDVIEPGREFAFAAGAACVPEDEWEPRPHAYDLCLTIGVLDSVNDPARFLRAIRTSLRDDSLMIGAAAGGDSLPALRVAMRAADQAADAASPHVHPRIAAASLASLLSDSGFVVPVVDVDRIQASYETLQRLVADLRAMGATNILDARSRRPLSRRSRDAANAAFRALGDGSRTTEAFELLHFAAWTPAKQG